MSAQTIIRGTIYEDFAATLLARVTGNAGTNITQASLTSITYAVYDRSVNPVTAVNTGTLTIASVVYDTLQTTDDRWDVDTTGYNFAYTFPGTLFPSGNREYRVEVKFTPTSGEAFPLWADLRTMEGFTS